MQKAFPKQYSMEMVEHKLLNAGNKTHNLWLYIQEKHHLSIDKLAEYMNFHVKNLSIDSMGNYTFPPSQAFCSTQLRSIIIIIDFERY